MGNKKRMTLDDHAAVGHELKIARDALQKVEVIICRTHGKTKELSGMISLVLDGLLKTISQADTVFFKENPQRKYSPYYGEIFERPDRDEGILIPDASAPPSARRPSGDLRPCRTCKRTRR